MQTAQSWALTKMAQRFPVLYRQFYLEAKGQGTGSKHNALSAGKAKRRLAKLHPTDYKELYEKGAGLGLPRNFYSQTKR